MRGMDASSSEQRRQFLTSSDVGKRLGITPAAVRDAAKRGALVPSAVTPGGTRLFSEEAVEAFARRRGAMA